SPYNIVTGVRAKPPHYCGSLTPNKCSSDTNNHVSTLLLKNHWTQWHNWVTPYSSEFYDMSKGIPAACRAGTVRCPAQIEYDTDDSMFKYFSDQGWMPRFLRTLSGGAAAQASGIVANYPWKELAAGTTVVDIGGGDGGLVALLLDQHLTMKGGILETKDAITQARNNFHPDKGKYAHVGNQVPRENLAEGDFFVKVEPATDVYTIKWCLHNWGDDASKLILRNIQLAIRKTHQSRLVILESVISDGHMGRMSRYADLNMMVAVGGGERDRDAWERLAAETGWQVSRIYPLRNAWPSAIEFSPVWSAPSSALGLLGLEEDSEEKGTSVRVEMQFLEPWDMKAKDQGRPGGGIRQDEYQLEGIYCFDTRCQSSGQGQVNAGHARLCLS
ncbi:O-methyltransferase domain containing protein, partial [Rhypophila decipiens]